MPEALIFDMDGTLAETATTWVAAERALFTYLGHEWTAEVAAHGLGMNANDLAATIHAVLRSKHPVTTAQKVMRDTLVAEYADSHIPEIPGAADLVRRLHGTCPLAVASGSPLEGINYALDQLGIRNYFDLVLSTETVPRGKPEPDGFLAAAEKLSVNPANCLVFEDSPVGARAAQAAGMACIVRPRMPSCDFSGINARLVKHWDEVSPADVFGRRQ